MVNGATQTVLDYASRLCLAPSYDNIFGTLKKLSEDEAQRVKAIVREPEQGLDLTIDNVQTYTKQWEPRIGRASVMKVGIARTAVELVGFDPQAVDLEGWPGVSVSARGSRRRSRSSQRTSLTL